MGKVVEKKKKKKKGRPSLLDLQKRKLLLEQEQQQKLQKPLTRNPNPNPNPNFPNPNTNFIRTRRHYKAAEEAEKAEQEEEQEEEEEEEEDEDDDEKKQKKLRLVLRLPRSYQAGHGVSEAASVSASNDESEDGEKPTKKRKIEACNGSASPAAIDNGSVDDKGKRKALTEKGTDDLPAGTPSDSAVTPLPDKKLLLFVLDRLQKKDTYGVFSEAVDPNELPDYHEVIEHPMDFGTVRKKLAADAYSNLEQFEKDVFLISSNAMRYNAADTIYFRQARTIQELARKNFENLRQDCEGTEMELRSTSKPKSSSTGKKVKRPVGRPPLQHHGGLDFSVEATLANAGDNSAWSNISHNSTRRGSGADKFGLAVSLANASVRASLGLRDSDTWLVDSRLDRMEEGSGSFLRARFGRKSLGLDENRRSTYMLTNQQASRHDSVLTTFDGDPKQLLFVGPHVEHNYARSLHRFAVGIGPIAWKVASRKLERILPPGSKLWPTGSTGPSRPAGTATLDPRPATSEALRVPNEPLRNDQNTLTHNPSSDARPSSEGTGARVNGGHGNFFAGYHPTKGPQVHQPTLNGFVGPEASRLLDIVSKGNNASLFQQKRPDSSENIAPAYQDNAKSSELVPISGGMVSNSGELGSNSSHEKIPWRRLSLNQKGGSMAPDLNVGFQSPDSGESQQPDLALQL
ncbi:bromodomain-containing protein 9 isoform X1 [Amborella trichopoda]|uniref:Bromo domain-containing protein n=1 Tax=Amborella trichopoda TaxID=13333 RepID=U5CV61_AMBTC|nr:bromodomain-containing protein 9 isoform X1 [Amborella trichopoda]ERN17211.1 hypothetical protein AMTR_s00044p00165320 [Amborella trichopoda]|eukprot:XP_020529965.1 bromodomain-containing protein 9 isoform X1 [Amborella trichopoda]